MATLKPKAYIETTIVSYLAALPSRDLLLAAHQQVTRDWWAERDAFDLYVSQLVAEASLPRRVWMRSTSQSRRSMAWTIC